MDNDVLALLAGCRKYTSSCVEVTDARLIRMMVAELKLPAVTNSKSGNQIVLLSCIVKERPQCRTR